MPGGFSAGHKRFYFQTVVMVLAKPVQSLGGVFVCRLFFSKA